MTNAEIVENARRILYNHDPNEAFSCAEIGQISAALVVARIVIQTQSNLENNKPLTLDELQEMEGEPVWVVFKPDADGYRFSTWVLVSVENDEGELIFVNNIGGKSSYGEVSNDIEGIYRRKP